MGMFDDLRCDYPLPGIGVCENEMQSKSLDCLMQHYTITAAGRLVLDDEDTNYHGDLEFHGSVNISGDWEYRRYVARFTEGQLQWIKTDSFEDDAPPDGE